MRHRLLPVLLGCALALTSGCSGGGPAAGPSSERSGPAGPHTVLLEQPDLPDGYVLSPPEPAPEMSAASKASVEGCGALLDRFGDAGSAPADTTVRFEAGNTGPFLAEAVSTGAGALGALRDLARRCGSFTDTDVDGTVTKVLVAPVPDFPVLGDEGIALQMSAGGGAGDDTFALSGYLVVLRLGGTTCTLVHFGQPGVDRTETEAIARTAVQKLKPQQ